MSDLTRADIESMNVKYLRLCYSDVAVLCDLALRLMDEALAMSERSERPAMPSDLTRAEIEALKADELKHLQCRRFSARSKLLVELCELALRLMDEATWRDIETAPRDRSAILVWCPENSCTFAVTWGEEKWMIFGARFAPLMHKPTHWQPLPQPARKE